MTRQPAPGTVLGQPHGHKGISLWRGRFDSAPDKILAALSEPTHLSWSLARYDVAGPRAHARALVRAGVLSQVQVGAVLQALDRLEQLVRAVLASAGPRVLAWEGSLLDGPAGGVQDCDPRSVGRVRRRCAHRAG